MSDLDRRAGVDLNPPEDVGWIARKLVAAGYEAWAVGGAVRDALAGAEPGDWDLTTSARPSEVRRIFRRTVPIGIEHGTVGIIARGGTMYEVTTFRRDVETFGRHARVVFADSLEEDLDRRDFTMNAVAWNPSTGEIRDPHGGIGDLASGVLRTVGDPRRRFEEDRLRVLRALRFAGTFALTVEVETWQAIRESANQLGNLSAERIREELRKVLTGQRDPSRSLELYSESGVLRALYPELDACRGVEDEEEGLDLWELSVRTTSFAARSRFPIRLAALLHRLGEAHGPLYGEVGEGAHLLGDSPPSGPSLDPGAQSSSSRPIEAAALGAAASAAAARGVMQRLRCSNAETDLVTHLIARHKPLPFASASDADLRRWVRLVGPAHLNDLFRLLLAQARAYRAPPERCARVIELHARASSLLAERPPLAVADLAIGGGHLRRLGIRPGPLYGRILERLLDLVIEDPALNVEQVLLGAAADMAGMDSQESQPS